MNAEKFIRNNPFPEDGASRNLKLVMDIQNPELVQYKNRNIEELFRINARLIWLTYRQHNYGESLDSVMSFMYEGIRKASETYRLDSGVPFYIYAMRVTRGLLQNYQAYHGGIIHIPILRRDDVVYEYNDITEYMDLGANNPVALTVVDESDEVIEEIYELVDRYMSLPIISDTTKYGLSIIGMLKTKSTHEICDELGIGDDKFRDSLRATLSKLKQYRKYGHGSIGI